MGNEIVIEAKNVDKKFSTSLKRSMAYGLADLLKDFLGIPIKRNKLRKSEFWALKDISFELKKGENLGIIGMNGSGKSTLLRLLTGIFPPDHGSIKVQGNIGALIAVGAGFHPHLTGRENIYLNGTILGMAKKEIDDKFQKIVDFSEIGQFLEAPVSTYSSGMRVRLGFSIAVHCEPEILLIDEILSVGDLSFKNKSLRYMSQLKNKAKAIIFISHDIEQVRLLCDRVIVMNKGRIIFDGETEEGIVVYQELTRDVRLDNFKKELEPTQLKGARRSLDDNETIQILKLGVLDEDRKETESIRMSEQLTIFCEFEVKKLVDSLSFYVTVNSDSTENFAISVVSSDNKKASFKNLKPGKYKVVTKIPDHHLMPGVYNPNITFRNDKTFETYQKFYSNIVFKVASENNQMERKGMIAVKEIWELDKLKA